MKFNRQILDLDPAAETDRIVEALRLHTRQTLRRRGAVVGISGGVDSAVVLALCVRAFGPDGVCALMLPDKDSDPVSEQLARDLAAQYGVKPVLEDITSAVEGFGAYRRRDAAIHNIVPEYDPAAGFKAKVVLQPNLLEEGSLNVFYVVVVQPDGATISKPLPPREFLEIMAASNFKQRARMTMLYYHAEVRHFAVIGTANRNEHDQGFFVKHGDGGVDIKALGHLYKTQIYQLARHLEVPEAIQKRPPTTDTYSAPSTQEEFFFRLPFETLDLLMYAREHDFPVGEVAEAMGLSPTQVQQAFDDIKRKERTTSYLRALPIDLSPVS
jgi:NAD+ synthase